MQRPLPSPATFPGPASLEQIYQYAEPRIVPLCRISDGMILGTGFFVHQEGYLLSADHITASGIPPDSLGALMSSEPGKPKTAIPLEIVARDPVHDLVLLRLKERGAAGHWVEKVGNSRKVLPGQEVSFAGFPYGQALTVTAPTLHAGLISSIKSAVDADNGRWIERLFQIHGSGAGGFSGAPLFLNGTREVVGVMTAHLNDEKNISFAIPIEYAEPLLRNLSVYEP